MNSRPLVLIAFALGAAALALAACTPAAAPAPPASPTKAPAVATPTVPSATSSGSAERGKAVFDANCNGCHPNGNTGVGPDIRGKSTDTVKSQVRKGSGGMPAFSPSQITDQQLEDVAEYVRSLK